MRIRQIPAASRSGARTGARQLLAQAEYRRLAEFRYQLRRFLKFSEDAAAREGLSAQQHQALLAIKAADGALSIGALAERLGIRHNTAVELIGRLAANRLIEREQNPQDRREVLIALTRRGERMLARLALAHRDELKKLAPLLRTLLAHFERGSRKGDGAVRRN